jgi:hypothetical protein
VSDAPQPPRNAVVVLLDSLNRHLLGAYGARASRAGTAFTVWTGPESGPRRPGGTSTLV